MSLIGADYEGRQDKPVENKLSHEYFGDTTNVWAGFSLGTGVAILVFFWFLNFMPFLFSGLMWIVKLVRWAHMALAYITLIWANWAVLGGLHSYDSRFKNLFWIHVVGYLLCFLVLEIITRIRRKHRAYGRSEGYYKI